MTFLTFFLQFLLVVTCFLLVAVILLQRTKGAGAGVTFGGMGESLFGAEMGNVLTKATVILGCVFLAIVLALSFLSKHTATGVSSSNSLMSGEGVAVPAAQTALPLPAGVLPADGELEETPLDEIPAATPAAAEAAAETTDEE